MLSVLIFMPLVFACAAAVIPSVRGCKITALVLSGGYFLLSLALFGMFDSSTAELQLVHKAKWLEFMGVQYFVGVDGISFWFVILTAFLSPVGVLASWNLIKEKTHAFYSCLFLMSSFVMGSFCALDTVLFYMFFEGSLIPLYFIIGIWGGKDRVRAAVKFFIYTGLGSLFMLIGICSLMYLVREDSGHLSASVLNFYKLKLEFSSLHWVNQQNILFLCFFIALAVKLPLAPFHTWLPLAHVEAPAPGSVWLAAVILKMGAYGFFRFLWPIFPESVLFFSPLMCWWGACSIVYGGLMALSQSSIKKLAAYSSVSHMGYILLGLFSLNIFGVTGAFYQMLAHAVSSAGLFLLAGMIYERTHSLEISDYGGAARVMPWAAAGFLCVGLSAIAFPGSGGFIAEFFVLFGAFTGRQFGALALALPAVVLSAGYVLYLMHRVFFGGEGALTHKLFALSAREKFLIVVLSAAVFLTGVFPGVFLKYAQPSLDHLMKHQSSYFLKIKEGRAP